MSANAVPLIGVSACRQQVGKNSSHTVGDKYVEAAGFAGLPLILPARDVAGDPNLVLERLDGILFTGSPSNVEPHHYNGAPSVAGTRHDLARDRLTLPLLQAAIAAGVPIVPVCVSSYIKHMRLNRWRSGKILIRSLPAIPTAGLTMDDMPMLINYFEYF